MCPLLSLATFLDQHSLLTPADERISSDIKKRAVHSHAIVISSTDAPFVIYYHRLCDLSLWNYEGVLTGFTLLIVKLNCICYSNLFCQFAFVSTSQNSFDGFIFLTSFFLQLPFIHNLLSICSYIHSNSPLGDAHFSCSFILSSFAEQVWVLLLLKRNSAVVTKEEQTIHCHLLHRFFSIVPTFY